MSYKPFGAWVNELETRVVSCKAGNYNDGYGDRLSLRNFLECDRVHRHIPELVVACVQLEEAGVPTGLTDDHLVAYAVLLIAEAYWELVLDLIPKQTAQDWKAHVGCSFVQRYANLGSAEVRRQVDTLQSAQA